MASPPVFDLRAGWRTPDGDLRLGTVPDGSYAPDASPPRYGIQQQARRGEPAFAPEAGTIVARWVDPASAIATAGEPPWNVGTAGVILQGASGVWHVIGGLQKLGLRKLGERVSEGAEVGVVDGPWSSRRAMDPDDSVMADGPRVYWRVALAPSATASQNLRALVVDPAEWLRQNSIVRLGPEPGTAPPPPPPKRASSGDGILVLIVILILVSTVGGKRR